MWTFKGCAGRLNAAKYLVEGITISAISKIPQTPSLLFLVLEAGKERGHSLAVAAPLQDFEQWEIRGTSPVAVDGTEKELDL